MASDNETAKVIATVNRAELCMKAMEGIPDPAAFVEAARKVVEDWKQAHDPDDFRFSLVNDLEVAMKPNGDSGKAVG